MDMQSLIEGGMTPNAAAVRLAREHWRRRTMPCKTYDAGVQWLKRNQRLFLDDLRNARWNERLDRMVERMDEENRRWQEQWLEEHGTTSAIALLDLKRMFEERDRENPRWRAQWRKRYRRDPDDMLEFFRASFTEPEETDEDVGEPAERRGFLAEPTDF
jgi:hypothetical protein